MGDIQLSSSAAVAIGGLLSTLCTAIGALFWALIAAKNAQIKREQDLTDKLLPATEENTRTVARLTELVAELAKELRTLNQEVRETRATSRGR